jgi:hypothetical protein
MSRKQDAATKLSPEILAEVEVKVARFRELVTNAARKRYLKAPEVDPQRSEWKRIRKDIRLLLPIFGRLVNGESYSALAAELGIHRSTLEQASWGLRCYAPRDLFGNERWSGLKTKEALRLVLPYWQERAKSKDDLAIRVVKEDYYRKNPTPYFPGPQN